MQGQGNSCRPLASRRSALTRYMAVALLTMSTVGLLTACGGEAPTDNSGSGGQAPPRVTAEVPDQQRDTLNELQSRAREVLAARLAAPAEDLKLVKDESVQWPDASLGCPREGNDVRPGDHAGASDDVPSTTRTPTKCIPPMRVRAWSRCRVRAVLPIDLARHWAARRTA